MRLIRRGRFAKRVLFALGLWVTPILFFIPVAGAQVTFVKSEGVASGSAALRPPGQATSRCGLESTPLDPSSRSGADSQACDRANEFGAAAFNSSFSLEVQESNGSVTGFVLSGTGRSNTEPHFPPFTESTNDAFGSGEAAVVVDIVGPVQATLSTTARVTRVIAPVPDGFVGRGSAIASATARLRSPVDCTSVLCDVDFQRCETTDLEPCQNDLPETVVLESGRYRFEVRSGTSAASNSSLEIGLASEATASMTLEVSFEEAGCEENGAKVPCECDVTWNNADGGGWGVRANWIPEQIPLDRGDGCDNAIFAFPLPHPVFFDTQTANGLFVRQGAPTFSGDRITLTGRTRAGGSPQPALGVGQDAFMTLSEGILQATHVVVGDVAGVAAANLTLSTGAELIATESLVVGQAQRGDLLALNAKITAARTTVGDAAGAAASTMTVQQGTINLGELRVAERGAASVEVTQGAQLSTGPVRVGNAPGFMGKLTITGSGTVWDSTAPVLVGSLGQGELSLQGGAMATASDTTVGDIGGEHGTLLIEGVSGVGVASSYTVAGAMSVGQGGLGDVTVRSGGKLEVADGLVVGEQAVSSVVVEKVGNGKTAQLSVLGEGLRIGGAALGEVIVLDGGELTASQLRVGMGSSLGSLDLLRASVQAGDPRPNLRVTGGATVGSSGVGVMNVKGGATARVQRLVLGGQVGADGDVIVEGDEFGASSLSVDEDCFVGESGPGKLTIRKGGFVGVGGVLSVGPGVSGGELLLQTGSGETQSRLIANGLINIFRQASVLGDSEFRSATGVRVLPGGVLRLQRGLRVQAPFLEANGRVIPVGRTLKQGTPEPPVFIDGNLIVGPAGSLEVEADGDGPVFAVAGDATLDGALAIRFLDEDGLAAGSNFDILEVTGAVNGAFASVSFPTRTEDFEGNATFVGGMLRVNVINPGQPVVGEGEGEGEEEGEYEPTPPGGCAGCDAKSGPLTQSLGDWLAVFLGLSTLLGTHLHFRRRMA